MLHGTEPDPEDARVLDITFILYADHTMNASTFTARIVASTLADMFSAITARDRHAQGAAARRGQRGGDEELRGGGKPENAEAYVRDRLERHEKIFGFGHAVYKTHRPARDDPETPLAGGVRTGRQPELHEIAEAIEKAVFEQKSLYPNVDFYAAAVFHVLGVPTDLMTPVFAAARMAGWTAHVREQYADNKVIRPGSRVRRSGAADVGPAGGANG